MCVSPIYCIGCPAAKQMMVVDPKRDIQDYLDIAYQEGMRITHIVNTHLHAGHISGDQEIILQCGSGYRSNIAASFLKDQGFSNIKSLAGGLFAWYNANLPLI